MLCREKEKEKKTPGKIWFSNIEEWEESGESNILFWESHRLLKIHVIPIFGWVNINYPAHQYKASQKQTSETLVLHCHSHFSCGVYSNLPSNDLEWLIRQCMVWMALSLVPPKPLLIFQHKMQQVHLQQMEKKNGRLTLKGVSEVNRQWSIRILIHIWSTLPGLVVWSDFC